MTTVKIYFGSMDMEPEELRHVVVAFRQDRVQVRHLLRAWLDMCARRRGRIIWRQFKVMPESPPWRVTLAKLLGIGVYYEDRVPAEPVITGRQVKTLWQLFDHRYLFLVNSRGRILQDLDSYLQFEKQDVVAIKWKEPEVAPAPAPLHQGEKAPSRPLPQPRPAEADPEMPEPEPVRVVNLRDDRFDAA